MGAVRLRIIGAGTIVDMTAERLKQVSKVDVRAVADTNLQVARRVAAKFGAAHVYDSHAGELDSTDVDAVYIATPPFLHRPMVLDALARQARHL